MSFVPKKQTFRASINEVTLGVGDKAVTIGGGVFGIGGMLLGVPITASVYKLLEADVDKRIKSKGK